MPESEARRFHRLTSYAVDRHWLVPSNDPAIRQDFLPLSGNREPSPLKVYPSGLARVALPAPARMNCEPPTDLGELSWLLHWSAGILRTRPDPSGRPVWFRAAGSAGNRQPVEVYVQASGVAGLADGVWHFHSADRTLTRVGPSAAAGTAIILTGVPWRTEWRYAERGYRHLWWDAGSMVANLALLARAGGRPLKVLLDFPDAEIASATGAQGQTELPLAIVVLGGRYGGYLPPEPAVHGDLGGGEWDFPLVRTTHEAARLEKWPEGEPAVAWTGEVDSSCAGSPGAEKLIGRRAATRNFSGEPVPLAALTGPLAVALGPAGREGDELMPVVRLFAHAVHGLPAGCYDVGEDGLVLLRAGDLRPEAWLTCLRQDAARDCSYLVLLGADLDGVLARRGERGYRHLQFAAGLAVSRWQLAATTLGLGATPLTVCDEAAARFLPPDAVSLLAVAVGSPRRREAGR